MITPSMRSEPHRAEKLWWIKLRHRARLILGRFPLVETPIIIAWRKTRFVLWQLRSKIVLFIGYFLGTHDKTINVDKVYWISPQKIVYSSLKEFSIHHFKGRILGGEWDHLEKKFEDLDVYHAFKQVCIEGKDWIDTTFYQGELHKINKGCVLWGCRNESDLRNRCKDLERLFHDIKNTGYKSQYQLLQAHKGHDPRVLSEEITVSIGRDGDLLFSDGAHRLAIAKLLNIQKIPVKIAVRHSKWVSFRKELLLYAKDKGGKIYPPCTHPDLSDVPAFHDSESRFMMIQNNLTAKHGLLLDIGSSFGYFCHRFEDTGFYCYAVESLQETRHFLRKLRRSENKRFEIIDESILESRKVRQMAFDVVLALNIFHHFLKTEETYHKFVNLLKNLQMGELFFEPHDSDETQMQGAYKNYSPDEFVNLIIQNSKFENGNLIGVADDGRLLYKLY